MKGNRDKKLVKKGFINCKIKKYSKDIHSNRISTNKSRWDRLLFLAHQLARDAGVQLLLFGYFPNDTVGSCGSWSFGKTTKLLEEKSDTKKYYKYWENVFSLIEAHRQKKETVEVEKCHEVATFNVGASVTMDSAGASDVENESEDAYLGEESEVGAFEEIIIPSDQENSMGTLESVEFESVKTIDQLQRLMDSANTTQSSATEQILNIDPVTTTFPFPPSLQHATVTAKTSSPPAIYVSSVANASKTPPVAKAPASASLLTNSDPALSVPLDVTCVTVATQASKTQQATIKDPAKTLLTTDANPAPSVSAVIRNQPPWWSSAKKRTGTKVLASRPYEQPSQKKSKKTEAEGNQTDKTSCNADVCLELPTMPNYNREAVLALLSREEELIKDAIEELEQVVDASINGEMDSDDENVIGGVELELQPSVKGLVKTVTALIRRTKKVVNNFNDIDQNRLDLFTEKVFSMSTEVDDLICSLFAPVNVKIAVERGNKLSSKLEDLLKTVKSIAGVNDVPWIELLSKAVKRNLKNLQSKGASR